MLAESCSVRLEKRKNGNASFQRSYARKMTLILAQGGVSVKLSWLIFEHCEISSSPVLRPLKTRGKLNRNSATTS